MEFSSEKQKAVICTPYIVAQTSKKVNLYIYFNILEYKSRRFFVDGTKKEKAFAFSFRVPLKLDAAAYKTPKQDEDRHVNDGGQDRAPQKGLIGV